MKELHYLWHILLVVMVLALVLAGWMYFTTTTAFTSNELHFYPFLFK